MKIDFSKEQTDQLYALMRAGGGAPHTIVKQALAAYLENHPLLAASAEGKKNDRSSNRSK
ncbi:hypothetical protein [Cronobacter turicensis]|uniref:hypothetical protein n=1 Tax=Cronobacter turicensis TaxID=413502 RepID=UPI0024AF110B|nr:hypothetical protein [Cronobacter turicensis]MDI7419079.1 hypothetical protein [Cronobacter turicensis]MDI7497969.1 hypothetical protein [Cronobacter turicensis]